MARITLAPIVSDVAGKIAGTVFSRWKGRNYIRKLVTPANPQSAAQTAQRNAMARCVELWRSLNSRVKTQLDTFATGIRMSGYNWFVGQNRVDEVTYDSNALLPHNPDRTMVQDYASAAGGAGEATLTWTDPADATCDQMASFYRLVETASEENEIHHDADTPIATATVTITGLNTGENYHFWLAPLLAADDDFGESDGDEQVAG